MIDGLLYICTGLYRHYPRAHSEIGQDTRGGTRPEEDNTGAFGMVFVPYGTLRCNTLFALLYCTVQYVYICTVHSGAAMGAGSFNFQFQSFNITEKFENFDNLCTHNILTCTKSTLCPC